MYNLIEIGEMGAVVAYLIVRCAVIFACWLCIFIANAVDFVSGRNAAKVCGEKVDSKGYRRTFTKLGDYYRVMIFALLFDLIGSLFEWYGLPFATILGSVAVIAIEGSSVIENSRRKRSHAADIPEMVRKIVQCSTTEQGKEILAHIVDEIGRKGNEVF